MYFIHLYQEILKNMNDVAVFEMDNGGDEFKALSTDIDKAINILIYTVTSYIWQRWKFEIDDKDAFRGELISLCIKYFGPKEIDLRLEPESKEQIVTIASDD